MFVYLLVFHGHTCEAALRNGHLYGKDELKYNSFTAKGSHLC